MRGNKCKAQDEYMASPSKATFSSFSFVPFLLTADVCNPSGFGLKGKGQLLLLLHPIEVTWADPNLGELIFIKHVDIY